MKIQDFKKYCSEIKGATDGLPNDENLIMFKVMGKIFAYNEDAPAENNTFKVMLKYDPEKAVEYRSKYAGITAAPGHYAKAWNTIELNSDVPEETIKELVIHSVEEVIKKLPKKQQSDYYSL